ncbi:suppressor APC domain-containing protein 2-like isoform X4 [Rana temporaria]|uniref:suppressor APC domain-containing protein 2-like isoform X4 n=1 Tax=Rana temporaria TaxID=8407 RepID=UPI001AACD1A6|nr:suppressor APC domain-containing protein 2-like isoform X4 [Rana temporaria]
MAVHAAYTILILPLHSSREALTFYLWGISKDHQCSIKLQRDIRENHQLRRMKELEQERDALLDGVQLVDKARDWYRERLHEAEQKRELQCTLDQAPPPPLLGSALLVQIQEVNRFLNDLMSYPEKGHRRQSPYSNKHSDTIASLRYQNQLLTREVTVQNERMWKLQRENEALYRELEERHLHRATFI